MFKKINKKLKSQLRIGLAVLFMIIAIFIISASINIRQATSKTILKYEENSNVLYRVYYNNQDYLASDIKEYQTNQIKNIRTNFNYNFLADAKFDCNYDYQLIGHLTVMNKQDIVWQRDFEYLKYQNETNKNSNGFKIIEFLDINYGEYEALVRKYVPNYLASYDTNLAVTLDIKVNGNYQKYNEKINGEASVIMNIPLMKDKTSFTITRDDVNEASVKGIENNAVKNIFLFFIGLIIFIATLIIMGNELLKAINEDKKALKYKANLKKYLKLLGEVTKVNKVPDLRTKTVNMVNDIEVIYIVQKQVKLPVIVTEKIKNAETWFIIFNGNIAHVFVLKK